MTAVIVIRKFEENETEHRRGILAGFQIGIGAQVIRRTPEISFKLFQLVFRHAVFRIGVCPIIDE